MQKKYLYCISAWEEVWEEVNDIKKEWLMFEALLKISPMLEGSIEKYDCIGFNCMIEYAGPYWKVRTDLKSLLNEHSPLPIPIPYTSDIFSIEE
jgi:hypothetical protein